MKTFFILLFSSSFALFGQETSSELPELNAGIIAFVKDNMGKKVGSGECWDLVQIPLDELGASWDGEYKFGKVVDPKKVEIFPGDIIQFERVVVKIEDGNKIMTENYAHHTAVVYEVLGKGSYKIAHQNTAYGGKKVIVSPLVIANVTKGKMVFFRPVK